jgi:hypothetical protein
MLLSSILRILTQHPEQPKVIEQPKVEKFDIEALAPPVENGSGLQKIEREIAAAAELLRPSGPHLTGIPPTGPSLEELIRAVSKFEKSEQSRVVDVFE